MTWDQWPPKYAMVFSTSLIKNNLFESVVWEQVNIENIQECVSWRHRLGTTLLIHIKLTNVQLFLAFLSFYVGSVNILFHSLWFASFMKPSHFASHIRNLHFLLVYSHCLKQKKNHKLVVALNKTPHWYFCLRCQCNNNAQFMIKWHNKIIKFFCCICCRKTALLCFLQISICWFIYLFIYFLYLLV